MSIDQDLWRVRRARTQMEVPPLPPPEPEPDPQALLLAQILGAVEGLQQVVASMPPPHVDVEAPDLADIVTAVNSLKPGATPDEIGEAIARRLAPQPVGPSVEMEALVKALEGIDSRLMGIGRQAYGGGTVSLRSGQVVEVSGALTDTQLRASAVDALVRDKVLVPKGYQQLTPTTSTALTVPNGSLYALLQARTADISYRDDGSAPTSTVGMRIILDNTLWYTGDLTALRFISATGILDVLYYGV